MTRNVTGYMIAKTGSFYPLNERLNGDFDTFRKSLETLHESEVYFRISEAPQTDFERIVNAVCFEYEVFPEDIFVTSRKRELAEPRQMAQAFLKKLTKLTLPEIGKLTGGKDHATVLYSVKKIKELVETDKDVREHFLNIKNNLS
jgi:chromosomal replication initiation ATPase DnaA